MRFPRLCRKRDSAIHQEQLKTKTIMKSKVSICLYSSENPNECVLSISLNTGQSVEECQRILSGLFPTLMQELSAPETRTYNDDVNM